MCVCVCVLGKHLNYNTFKDSYISSYLIYQDPHKWVAQASLDIQEALAVQSQCNQHCNEAHIQSVGAERGSGGFLSRVMNME